MSSSLKFISEILLIFLLSAMVFDYGQIKSTKAIIKDTVDLSTKAASLQLDEDSDKIGSGTFDIDVAKAKAVNEEIFKANTNDKIYGYVVDTDVINAHSTQNYLAPNGKTYTISNPTVFCTVKYKYNGIIFNKDITVDLMSGSVLENKNDLGK